jgi:predicted nucleic acid-binding protein
MEPDNASALVVVLDAGPLIHLDELGMLTLLKDCKELLVPDAVWHEVERHRPTLFDSTGPNVNRVVPRAPCSPALVALSRLFPLHLGETHALQIASERNVDLLLTDDTAARLAAKQLTIPVHGTLGILLRAVRRQQLTATEVISLLRKIPEHSTLHVRPSLLEEIIGQVERLN